MDTKICIDCKIEKDISAFPIRIENGIIKGHRGRCKICARARARIKHHKFKEENLNGTAKITFRIKKCCSCKQEKPITEFHKNIQQQYGFEKRCKDCARTKQKRYKATPRGKFREYRWHASRRNLQFELSYFDVATMIEQNCFYCDKPNSHGIDRKQNDVGYILTNCVPCCMICNYAKNTLDIEDFIRLCQTIVENIKKKNK